MPLIGCNWKETKVQTAKVAAHFQSKYLGNQYSSCFTQFHNFKDKSKSFYKQPIPIILLSNLIYLLTYLVNKDILIKRFMSDIFTQPFVCPPYFFIRLMYPIVHHLVFGSRYLMPLVEPNMFVIKMGQCYFTFSIESFGFRHSDLGCPTCGSVNWFVQVTANFICPHVKSNSKFIF